MWSNSAPMRVDVVDVVISHTASRCGANRRWSQ